jgi:hypothetical protein
MQLLYLSLCSSLSSTKISRSLVHGQKQGQLCQSSWLSEPLLFHLHTAILLAFQIMPMPRYVPGSLVDMQVSLKVNSLFFFLMLRSFFLCSGRFDCWQVAIAGIHFVTGFGMLVGSLVMGKVDETKVI